MKAEETNLYQIITHLNVNVLDQSGYLNGNPLSVEDFLQAVDGIIELKN